MIPQSTPSIIGRSAPLGSRSAKQASLLRRPVRLDRPVQNAKVLTIAVATIFVMSADGERASSSTPVASVATVSLGPAPVLVPLADARIAVVSAFDTDAECGGWRAESSIAGMRVAGGSLAVRTSGADPYLIGPEIDVDCSTYQFMALRCRADVSGSTEIYFGDGETRAFAEGRRVAIEMQPSDDFVTYEIDLRTIPAWSGRVHALRIDPVNGVHETAANFELDWIAVYQAPPRLQPLLPRWASPDKLIVGFENRGGWASELPIEFLCDGAVLGRIGRLEHAASIELPLDASQFAPTAWIEAQYHGRTIWRGRVVRPPPYSDPTGPSTREGDVPTSISIASGTGILHGPAARTVRLSPIASVTLLDPQGTHTYVEFDPAHLERQGEADVYRETLADARVGDLVCSVVVTGTEVATTLESCADLEVLRFEGPRMIQSRPHTHALLPGLEYIEAAETSSNKAWTGAVYGPRERPPAFRVTAPMVAVEYERADDIPARDPAQPAWVASMRWAAPGPDATTTPAVDFRSYGLSNSFASVFLPARAFTDLSGERFAAQPQKLIAGTPLALVVEFALDRGTIEDVFERYWLPRIPEPPALGFVTPKEREPGAERPGPGTSAAVERVLAISMEAYTKTLFDGAGRWKTHVAIQEPYCNRPEMAAAVLIESARSGREELATAVGRQSEESIESLVGSAATFVDATKRALASAAFAAMTPDGGIAYDATDATSERIEQMTKFHGAGGELLGERGETNAGLIAEKSLPLLEYAACTRDPIYVAASLRALARMNRFTVPRGCQTWEIHADTPDLYAAALCARANLWGWRVTGNEHYLDEAQRWLRTGLPFFYWWKPAVESPVRAVHIANENGEGPILEELETTMFYADPDREVLPFASIPVFGTSWYAVPWFGIPVQWCGLAWGNAVREIDAIRPMPEYVQIADGIFRSAANQQCDRGYLAGTLPDSWDLATNLSRQPFIVPERLVEYAYRTLGVPHAGALEYLRLDGVEWTHVASGSILERVEQVDGRLSLSARFFAGQDASLILGGTRRPLRSVRVGGIELGAGTGLGQYHWIECGSGRSVLVVRWRSTSTDRIDVEIEIEP